MFERRLKIFLFVLFLTTLVLILRAGQLQIVRRSHWTEAAVDALKQEQLIETTRGSIRDCKGIVIAQDVACIDACVDYRALTEPPDDDWVSSLALDWARQQRGDEWRAANSARRKQMVAEEKHHIVDRIHIMFATLAREGSRTSEQIDQVRQDIVRRVEMARRNTWYRKFQVARNAYDGAHAEPEPSSWWKNWLNDDSRSAPQLDDFDVKVAEQTEAQPILQAITFDVQNRLGKEIETFPGLSLRPGLVRSYPNGAEAACHLLGHLSRVSRADMDHDPNVKDELRKYQFTDMVGRNGLEKLCEPLLRGTRGRIERYMGGDAETVSTSPPVPGQDMTSTIDVDLQQSVLSLFQHARVVFTTKNHIDDQAREVSMHGGAVLIDLRNNEVRALVSNPTFDPNTLDDDYRLLASDAMNRPLLSRATQFPVETGSTIKPVVGLGAITQGVLGLNEGIECTGYLTINGRRVRWGRCWVASKFENEIPNVAHHPIPDNAPHRGHDGNPDGFLTFSDALERSCNVFFETVGHRLGLSGLSYWMDRFGLGRMTGIGIEESHGTLPDSYSGVNPFYASFAGGIGESCVAATTLQMANVAASIAHDGIWMRPTLLTMDESSQLRALARGAAAATTQPTNTTAWWNVPDRVDLQLSPAGVAAAREGMYRVVNSPGGTGPGLRSDRVVIAGKTGTAQTSLFRRLKVDANGNAEMDDRGKRQYEFIPPSTRENPNPLAPWYICYDDQGKDLKHAWIIGYAPAAHPQVAFAVMVEYGGSGGVVAAGIAKGMLDAAIRDGYLSPDQPVTARLDPTDTVR